MEGGLVSHGALVIQEGEVRNVRKLADAILEHSQITGRDKIVIIQDNLIGWQANVRCLLIKGYLNGTKPKT